MSKESHSFSVSVACQIGVNSAIMLQHFIFLQRYSPDGWVKKSAKSIQETYQYLTEKEIRGAIERLCKGGYVFDKIENAVKADRTKSFFVSELGHKLYETQPFALLSNGVPKRANGFDKRANDNFPKGQMLIKEDCIFNSSVVDVPPPPPVFEKSAETLGLKEEVFEKTGAPPAAPPPAPSFTLAGHIQAMRGNHDLEFVFCRDTRLPREVFNTAIDEYHLHAKSISKEGSLQAISQHFKNWFRTPAVIEKLRPKPQQPATRSPYAAPAGPVKFG